jgi:hypothetical protein
MEKQAKKRAKQRVEAEKGKITTRPKTTSGRRRQAAAASARAAKEGLVVAAAAARVQGTLRLVVAAARLRQRSSRHCVESSAKK